eukprot:jgi/Picsp_1/2741/NSC_00969-R1_---NA---
MCAGQGGDPKDAFKAPKAVDIHAEMSDGSDTESDNPSRGLASSDNLPKSACESQDIDLGSDQISPPEEGGPVSRKMARKLRKLDSSVADSDKESQDELAEKDSASMEIHSKPKNSKPKSSKRKVAPAPKQCYKVDLSHYKANDSATSVESAVDPSGVIIASTAQQVPCKTNLVKLARDQSIMMAAKPSRGHLLGQNEGKKCMPVQKNEIYKNKMTQKECLNWLERQIFEEKMLELVSPPARLSATPSDQCDEGSKSEDAHLWSDID